MSNACLVCLSTNFRKIIFMTKIKKKKEEEKETKKNKIKYNEN